MFKKRSESNAASYSKASATKDASSTPTFRSMTNEALQGREWERKSWRRSLLRRMDRHRTDRSDRRHHDEFVPSGANDSSRSRVGTSVRDKVRPRIRRRAWYFTERTSNRNFSQLGKDRHYGMRTRTDGREAAWKDYGRIRHDEFTMTSFFGEHVVHVLHLRMIRRDTDFPNFEPKCTRMIIKICMNYDSKFIWIKCLN